MRMRLGYTLNFTKEFEKALRQGWGRNFDEHLQWMLRVFAGVFQWSIVPQLYTVFKRERRAVDVGFWVNIAPEETLVQILVSPQGPSVINWIFFLNGVEGDDSDFLRFPFRIDPAWNRAQLEQSAHDAATRLAADLAREGLPKGIRRAISDISHAMKWAAGNNWEHHQTKPWMVFD